MTDIAKCKGLNCPLKENCYRYTAVADEFWQSYGSFFYNEEKEECDYFWNIKDRDEKANKRGIT